jgi:hypothetical protein
MSVENQAGGRGRLAEVLAGRGGKAAPEAPFVIEHREALIYMVRARSKDRLRDEIISFERHVKPCSATATAPR